MEQMGTNLAVPAGPEHRNVGDQQPELGQELLVSRFVLGLLLLGAEELLARLEAVQQEIDASGELASAGLLSGDETTADLLGYLALGTMVRGQRVLSRTIRQGLRFSLRTATWGLGALDWITTTPLVRPFRRTLEPWGWELVQEALAAIGEGRTEAQSARLLAGRAVGDIVDDVIEVMVENPELVESVRRLLAQQSAGLAGTIVDNTRQITATADSMAEGVLRRLLQRRPRQELPPSPLAGKPLTVYLAQPSAQGAKDDDQ